MSVPWEVTEPCLATSSPSTVHFLTIYATTLSKGENVGLHPSKNQHVCNLGPDGQESWKFSPRRLVLCWISSELFKLHSNYMLALVFHHGREQRSPWRIIFHSFLCPQTLAQCLAQSRHLISTKRWMTGWMSEWLRRVKQSITVKELKGYM